MNTLISSLWIKTSTRNQQKICAQLQIKCYNVLVKNDLALVDLVQFDLISSKLHLLFHILCSSSSPPVCMKAPWWWRIFRLSPPRLVQTSHQTGKGVNHVLIGSISGSVSPCPCEIRRAVGWGPGRCPDLGRPSSWLHRRPAGQRGGTASCHQSRRPETRLRGVLPHSRRSVYPVAMEHEECIFKTRCPSILKKS